jgi:site-specific recombinase XerD
VTEHRIDLPPFAKAYLSETTRRHTERVVVLFHRWLLRSGRRLSTVSGRDVGQFLAGPAGRAVERMTRNNYRYEVRRYLRWLEERGLAGPFDAQELEGYHRKPLPEEVRRFLQFLAPTRRRATVCIYRSVLRCFHQWLGERGLAIERADRSACLEWAQHLHQAGLHPATRVNQLICLRKYLDWLWEQGVVPASGRELIRSGDLPKKPDYLPRPLPPEADQELQKRLKHSDSSVALGLYLMRRTGLRVGELRRLARDCVRADHGGNHFLKVPLGKLDNERLVPLDESALAAAAELQRRARAQSRWLIEGARARPVSTSTYQSTLVKLAGDLPLSEPLTTHRLRHSFATSLMNGGMSLLGIMKLLGHRDQRMTLRYTQIADETVGREYFEALSRIAERYQLVRPGAESDTSADPAALIDDAIRWVTKNLCTEKLERRAQLLIRRLQAARDELEQLRAMVEPPQ